MPSLQLTRNKNKFFDWSQKGNFPSYDKNQIYKPTMPALPSIHMPAAASKNINLHGRCTHGLIS